MGSTPGSLLPGHSDSCIGAAGSMARYHDMEDSHPTELPDPQWALCEKYTMAIQGHYDFFFVITK